MRHGVRDCRDVGRRAQQKKKLSMNIREAIREYLKVMEMLHINKYLNNDNSV